MREIRLRAKAKINLGLDVLRKRDDGYHEVRMIMHTIGLYDRIVLRPSENEGITLRTNLGFLPVNGDNLAYKAAKMLMDEFAVREGLEIELNKYIPVAAGMAGGSSDAAAVLVGVNRLFGLRLNKEELMKRGRQIGADVPFCVMRGTALAEGIGEILTPLPPLPECYILIAKPPVNVSTKFVYESLRANELKEHPDIDGQIEALKNQDLLALAKRMGNVLETVTIPAYPVIGRIKEKMLELGAINTLMSGSGPTVFGLFTDRQRAQDAYEKMRAAGEAKHVYLVTQGHSAARAMETQV
ncbi:MAG: 4-(cytidine 5'-diphospho)-2-C-methyl-D-erythritol kinase [Eubacteriales bacterium]|nr:4-(cytidine 5'-diphospho)-2-C-methyl-D-erythritol kinase [Eubacteriales bacterium]